MSVSETYGGNIVVVQGPFEYSAMASGALAEGRVVEINTAVATNVDQCCVKLATENCPNPVGYVDADWEASDMCVVYTEGIARLEDSGSGVTIAERVMCAADGKVKTYASGTAGAIVGVAMETITAAAFGKIYVNISYNSDVA